ncbi:Gfo/Idh/MocA family oxidoreductase [Domibacillus sp. PGB-M46]|uniref:Gfo/Idh/MocA family protein n=1 Tax=Domibacillus sp. PGB-M46 TaxID=2910255 RepID=UPI001F5792A6|nr:Gfo/Idh/MocA family oxidoreductase [Domibacillus sp. PGB-M46]MCI2255705.1 Gfo/Idh/MocA family oxidoreductase [Domibacillus sp. PGB-M46]
MNIATIGTSMITERFIDAVGKTDALTFAGAFSRSVEKAKGLGAPRVFTDLAELASDETVDVVYIASPNSLHFEQALFLMKHKKHIICEKPMFSTAGQCREAFQTAEENGVFLFEAFRNLYTPNHARLKEVVEKVGPIRHSFLQYMKYSSRYDNVLAGEEPNIFSPKFSGGALVDLGVYPISLAVSLFGRPERISAHVTMLPTGVDGSGSVVLDYGTHVCTTMFSKITDSFLPGEISGENGTISIDHVAPIASIQFTDRLSGEQEQLAVAEEENDMMYEAEAIAKAIQSNDRNLYEHYRNISEIVIEITEEARRQAGVVFTS